MVNDNTFPKQQLKKEKFKIVRGDDCMYDYVLSIVCVWRWVYVGLWIIDKQQMTADYKIFPSIWAPSARKVEHTHWMADSEKLTLKFAPRYFNVNSSCF